MTTVLPQKTLMDQEVRRELGEQLLGRDLEDTSTVTSTNESFV